MLRQFGETARKRMRVDDGGYRRDHLRLLAQRVEVEDKEVRILGSKSSLLQTLVAISNSGVKPDTLGVPSLFRNGGETGIRTLGTLLTHTRFPSVRLKPLGHLSRAGGLCSQSCRR